MSIPTPNQIRFASSFSQGRWRRPIPLLASPTGPLGVAAPSVVMNPVVMDHLLGAHLLIGNSGDYSPVSVELLIRFGKETWLSGRLSPEGEQNGTPQHRTRVVKAPLDRRLDRLPKPPRSDGTGSTES